MRPHLSPDELGIHVPSPRVLNLMAVLWPAFVMAGVLEMVVFAFLDPALLSWVEAGWRKETVYSVSFFVFWAVMSAGAWFTLMMARPVDQIGRLPHHA